MGNPWRKVKTAFGLHLCTYAPMAADDGSPSDEIAGRSSEVDPYSPASDYRSLVPAEPGLRLSKSGSWSSLKKTCSICLDSMRPGHGHAIFTAECSHKFHFHCIASSVKHGNQLCPVCRAKWKEIPFQVPQSPELPHGRARVSPAIAIVWPHDDGHMNITRRLSHINSSNRQHQNQNLYQPVEPSVFDDDEPLDAQQRTSQDSSIEKIDIKTYPEFQAIPRSASEDNFAILIHLKAPQASAWPPVHQGRSIQVSPTASSRAPVDLVTVLDVSGSMAGTKLALLKRAMGFVIQNLRPSDRLSVVAFSSNARRIFHLRRMSDSGRQLALQAVNSLVSGGGTNIAEGLKKGVKVIEERKEKNPVCSIILLSDGQDTYFAPSGGGGGSREEPPDYRLLVPQSIRGTTGHPVPVHAFGFGGDHDSACMHSISEASGGTFSFIEAEGLIQDAFAQCIGGILSVVVQNVNVRLDCVRPGVRLTLIKSGNYGNMTSADARMGSIDVGDLYADEERDFLVFLSIPPAASLDEVSLLQVCCVYRDLATNEAVRVESDEVRIERPESLGARVMSVEVDRERNRVHAAEDMAEARAAAERGELSEAVYILEQRRRILAESLAGQTGDWLCTALDAELREMQERMANRQRYEASGRAYVLSGLSSHSWQRATTRGDSTEIGGGRMHAYQTQSMVEMLHRSQTLSIPARRPSQLLVGSSQPPVVRRTESFPSKPQPR